MRQTPPNATELARAAEHEVETWRALWHRDLRQAVTLAQGTIDRLGGGDELRPYRCFWLYLAASWAAELADQTGNDTDAELAATLTRETEGCARTLSWMPRIDPTAAPVGAGAEHDERAERAADKLERLGIRGLAFENKLAEIDAQLTQGEATPFELGLTGLGELLGFDAVHPGGQAEPDSAWRDGEKLWLLFEAKTEERPDNPVSPAEVRQAGTHHEWVRNQLEWPEPERSVTMIVAWKQRIETEAAAIAREVRLVSPLAVREIAARTFAVHREIRARARGLSDEQLGAAFAEEFRRQRLDSDALIAQLGARRIAAG